VQINESAALIVTSAVKFTTRAVSKAALHEEEHGVAGASYVFERGVGGGAQRVATGASAAPRRKLPDSAKNGRAEKNV
jgi:hypothetical protein